MELLINIQDLKQLGLIHDNVDVKIIRNTMIMVQDMNIQGVTGTPLYDELLRRVKENDWDANYRNLIEKYVYKSLVAWCNYYILEALNNQITNKAVGRNNDENLNANSHEQNNEFKKQLYRLAEFYDIKMMGFLKDNEEVYPEYKEHRCKHEDVEKKDSKSNGIKGWIKV